MKLSVYSKILAAIVIVFAMLGTASAQGFDSIERGRAKDMLKSIKAKIKGNYYDTTFRGIDLDARFKAAEEKLNEAASLGQAFSIIAQVLLDFNDSHTRFYPPATNVSIEYGWEMQMIGDKCFVTSVKPGSDAAAKGLKPGDQILSVNNFRPSRSEFWKMKYFYYTLSPRTKMQVIAQSPEAKEPQQLEIASKVTQQKRILDLNSSMDVNDIIRQMEKEARSQYHRFQMVDDVVIWQMPGFDFMPEQVDTLMKNRVNGKNALILDLRGNQGGYVVTLERLAGYFFDKDVKIADTKGRKEAKPVTAKPQGANGFKGKIVVLTDSRSASAAEVFARLMQLEKRGVVIGDQSSGKVMQSLAHSMEMGADKVVFYAVSITNADLIMTDGKSLENAGVTPDELLMPSGVDLAAQRDPVLARALELVGKKVSPEQAGKFFPIEWEK